ncbi:MAG: thiamine-phosphate kinase [Planctomycetota bacterium]|nr:thiamine-phosphate kinase [Planctomycetota bacterium]
MEDRFLKWLYERMSFFKKPLLVGVGDDCAVLAPQKEKIVVTTDTILEEVHFKPDTSPEDVGYKAASVSLSDIAAMGAKPLVLFAAAALPYKHSGGYAKRIVEGILDALGMFGVQLAGGNYALWSYPAAVTTTALGVSAKPLLRSGAKPNDLICVTGSLGGSILEKHLRFTPRVNEALYLSQNYKINAMMDISDGLALDLSRMMEASKTGCIIFESKLPISEDAIRLSKKDGISPVRHALSDGEDFEILFTMPKQEAKRLLNDKKIRIPISVIGEVSRERAMYFVRANGKKERLKPEGYIHGKRVGDSLKRRDCRNW